jgi:hypothetical protein
MALVLNFVSLFNIWKRLSDRQQNVTSDSALGVTFHDIRNMLQFLRRGCAKNII